MSIFFHDDYRSLNNRESTQPHFVKTGVKVTFGGLRLTAKSFSSKLAGTFVKGARVKAKIKKISHFATDFHSKSFISETKGTRGLRYTFSESSLQDLFKS